MKKLCCLFLMAAMMLAAMVPPVFGLVQENSILLTFDDRSSFEAGKDFQVGGTLKASQVSLSTEKDNTTGTGKSLKLSNLANYYDRIKLPVFHEVGKTYIVTLCVYPLVDTNLMLAGIGKSGTDTSTTPYTEKIYPIKANQWTEVEYEYTYAQETRPMLSIEQAKNDVFSDTLYIDDISVSIKGEPAPQKPENNGGSGENSNNADAVTVNIFDFDNISSFQEANITSGGATMEDGMLVDDTLFYGSSGKSLKTDYRDIHYNRLKFNNAFENMEMEKGAIYNITLKAMVNPKSKIDEGYFFISLITFEGTAGDGKEYYSNSKYRYLVTKDGWSDICLSYQSDGSPLYGVAVEQVSPQNDVYLAEDYVVRCVNYDQLEIRKADTMLPENILPGSVPPSISEKLENVVAVNIDGKRVLYSDVPAQIVGERTLVPMRKTFEKLHAAILWDGPTQTVTAFQGKDEIKIAIGSKTAYVNGNPLELDVPAQLVDDRTMVPLRFVAESLGAQVEWNEETKHVDIKTTQKNEINIYKTSLKQKIEGFGAAANHNAWYLQNKTKPEIQTKVLQSLFGTEGKDIGLTLLRLEVNPFKEGDQSNFNPEMQMTINPAKDVWDFNTDMHQRWMADEALKINPEVKFLASVWSPPAWMKTNQSVVGNTQIPNKLDPAHYEDYATYISTWVDRYVNEYGYDIKWIGLQNEPIVNTDYASCIYTPVEAEAMAMEVIDKFEEKGLEPLIGVVEGCNLKSEDRFLKSWSDELISRMGCITVHGYDYEDGYFDTYDFEKYNLPMIQTEMNEGAKVAKDYSIISGLKTATKVWDALEHGYSAWFYWYGSRLIDGDLPSNCESLIDYNNETGTILYGKEYYTIAQFSRFMRPGDYRVSSYSDTDDLQVVSSINPDTGKLSVVVINNTDSAVETAINGFGAQSAAVYHTTEQENFEKQPDVLIENGSLQYTFGARSITTFAEQ